MEKRKMWKIVHQALGLNKELVQLSVNLIALSNKMKIIGKSKSIAMILKNRA